MNLLFFDNTTHFEIYTASTNPPRGQPKQGPCYLAHELDLLRSSSGNKRVGTFLNTTSQQTIVPNHKVHP